MSNNKSELQIVHKVVNTLVSEKEIKEFLFSILNMDLDITENEGYFRKNTKKLGYDTEADRIIDESMKKYDFKKANDFKKLVQEVSTFISNQAYYGVCKLSIVEINEFNFSIVFVSGGHSEF